MTGAKHITYSAVVAPESLTSKATNSKTEPVIIKKYANRRLYNTDTSTYVTLDDLAEMVRLGRETGARAETLMGLAGLGGIRTEGGLLPEIQDPLPDHQR